MAGAGRDCHRGNRNQSNDRFHSRDQSSTWHQKVHSTEADAEALDPSTIPSITRADKQLTQIMKSTLNSTYNEVTFNEKLAITKKNLHTKYTAFTYNDITLNKKPPIMKQNLHIFFFIIGRVECT